MYGRGGDQDGENAEGGHPVRSKSQGKNEHGALILRLGGSVGWSIVSYTEMVQVEFPVRTRA